jgi:hypothetical protein
MSKIHSRPTQLETANTANNKNTVPDYTMAAMLAAYRAFNGGLSSGGSTISAIA